MSQVCLRAVRSIPEVGSSNMMIVELPISAMARLSFLFIPPDRFFDNTLVFSTSPTSEIFSRILSEISYLSVSPLNKQKRYKCSSTVMSANNMLC